MAVIGVNLPAGFIPDDIKSLGLFNPDLKHAHNNKVMANGFAIGTSDTPRFIFARRCTEMKTMLLASVAEQLV